jgi:aminopeptidase N
MQNKFSRQHCTRFALIFSTLGLLVIFFASCSPPPLMPEPSPTPEIFDTLAIVLPSKTVTPTWTPSPEPTPSPTPTLEPTHLPQTGGRSIGDAYAPELGNIGYDVQHYTLQFALDPAHTYVDGTANIQAVATLDNLIELSLDFSGYEIEQLTVDNLPAEYTRARGKFIITLPEPLSKGQSFTIFVDYRGPPIQTGSRYVPFIHHLGLQFLPGNIYAVSEPDGARYWFPSNDHPLDKATFTIEITVPAGLEAISNGVLTREFSNPDRTTYIWEHNSPMATYLATVAVGDYEFLPATSPNGTPIGHYYFADLSEPFQQTVSITGEALDWMGEIFGQYPFESFGFVTARVIRASLETQTMVILSENMLNEETVIHEIAHQWFGDWVSMASWADMWHNEGFAVYISLMWQTRNTPDSLDIFMQNLAATVDREASTDPLGNLPPQRMFGFDSYQRGALMIHNLRRLVGDEAFFNGLRAYFELYGGGAATREEFITVMEDKSRMDLNAFFMEWLD